jgi:Protein kinase domain
VAKGTTIAIGALLLLAGAGALGWSLTQAKAGTSPEALQKVVAIIDGEIKQRRAQTQTRAESTAIQSPLVAAIGSDAATVADQFTHGDFKVMMPDAGETMELGQTQEGRYSRLLLLPEGAAPTKYAGQEGPHLLLGAMAQVTQVKKIAPADQQRQAEGYVGYLAVSRELDLSAAKAELAALGVPARLTHDQSSMLLGAEPPAGAKLTSLPVPSEAGLSLAVSATLPTPRPLVPMAAGGASLLAGLMLIFLGLSRRGGAGAAQPMPANASTGPGSTGVGLAGMAAGTPVAPGSVTVLSGPGPGHSIAGLTAGSVLGRWEIVKLLGSGGMADVHLARARGEAGFEKLVALKVMHPFLARSERAVAHFLDEARVAAQIVHANVVQIYDLGKSGDDYIIVMEYVDGSNLDSLMASVRAGGRQVPIPVALGILRRICDGLTAAHHAIAKDGTPLMIVHRDVKSGNVLVSRGGVVKVVDFGIAKAAQQSHVTMAGETKGTPSMMAPEQRVGDVVDQRADVYSTAAVGYELLTGAAVNLDLAALAHLGTEGWPHLPKPSAIRPELPAELDDILLRAMSFDRASRPADCLALETQFEEIAKRYHLECSDKEIARWAQAELAILNGEPTLPASSLSPVQKNW